MIWNHPTTTTRLNNVSRWFLTSIFLVGRNSNIDMYLNFTSYDLDQSTWSFGASTIPRRYRPKVLEESKCLDFRHVFFNASVKGEDIFRGRMHTAKGMLEEAISQKRWKQALDEDTHKILCSWEALTGTVSSSKKYPWNNDSLRGTWGCFEAQTCSLRHESLGSECSHKHHRRSEPENTRPLPSCSTPRRTTKHLTHSNFQSGNFMVPVTDLHIFRLVSLYT